MNEKLKQDAGVTWRALAYYLRAGYEHAAGLWEASHDKEVEDAVNRIFGAIDQARRDAVHDVLTAPGLNSKISTIDGRLDRLERAAVYAAGATRLDESVPVTESPYMFSGDDADERITRVIKALAGPLPASEEAPQTNGANHAAGACACGCGIELTADADSAGGVMYEMVWRKMPWRAVLWTAWGMLRYRMVCLNMYAEEE